MKNKKILVEDIGMQAYETAFHMQNQLFEEIKQIKTGNRKQNIKRQTPNYFLFTEHPHVYTLGKSGKEEHLLLPENELAKKHVRFIKTNRGGDITYHGPGQIVGYPIIDLDNFDLDIIGYMRRLEEVIIRVLKEYGLESGRSEGETGVWLDAGKPRARKICAMGVRTSKWVTMHGFALNVYTNLEYFNYIIPCGIRNKGVTSMEKELRYVPDIKEVKKKILFHFGEVFNAEMQPAKIYAKT